MQLSLRTRLTVWYAVLLVLTVALFSTAVLWLHWRLLLDQFDDGLKSVSTTASGLLGEELVELKSLPLAAREVAAVVRPEDGAVQVLDADGAPVGTAAPRIPLPVMRAGAFPRAAATLRDPGGRPWRVLVRARSAGGRQYFVVVGAPLDEAAGQWRTLLKASLIGIPLALLFAIAGGWWVARRGLRPLAGMAAQSQGITARTLDRRLTVPASTTELAQLAGAFNHVLDRLGSALLTQRRFMADASHELRTPISVMRTAADVTLSQPSRQETEYRDALGVVSQQASRLTRLVDDMLILARADGGGYPIRLARLDLAALVDECARDLGAAAAAKNITIETALEPLEMTGDDALLRRMTLNVLGNALIYTPAGGRVALTLTRADGDMLLRVADSGPGIPAADRERVFERFVRLDAARAAGGAGLGLAIARWVAEAHGGTLRVLSSGADGTVFAAQLPA